MAKLPQFQFQQGGQKLEAVLSQMQSAWAALLNPLLARPQNMSTILADVDLDTGDNSVPHTLNRELIGWSIIRINAGVEIYDKQSTNDNPDSTLILNASAPCTVSLEVF